MQTMLIKFNLVSIFLPTLINTITGYPSSDQAGQRSIVRRSSAEQPHFNYIDQKEWLTFENSECGGDRQSPINLDPSSASVDKSLELHLNSYSRPVEPNMGHNVYSTGHSLKLDLNESMVGEYSITGSAIDGTCNCNSIMELRQVHLHWGETSMSGSEHTIAGEHFAAEFHFVHHNAKYKNNKEKILSNKDGLAVIGVIAKNGDPNPGLDILLASMGSNKSSNINYPLVSKFNLFDFLPKNTKSFYKYEGSLTTPNCQEIVNWIVMKDLITVSNDQIEKLRSLVDSHGEEMKSVVRDVQPLKGRTVFQSDSGSMISPIGLGYVILYLIMHILVIQKSVLN